eukprot:3878847-Amphidinium_carterae.1
MSQTETRKPESASAQPWSKGWTRLALSAGPCKDPSAQVRWKASCGPRPRPKPSQILRSSQRICGSVLPAQGRKRPARH